jgi:FMN phosphatase YigB (HAD superfamily)
MTDAVPLVFLLDVDNTLLDNDRFRDDLTARLEQDFGAAERDRYWALFEAIRAERSRADYLAALQEFSTGLGDHPEILQMSAFMLEYPFASRLYPRALEVIEHLNAIGTTVVLSDGDVVFQPRKVQRSGIWAAVHGRVLIYQHKEKALDSMQRRYPARHYVMVDDKAALLQSMKRVMGTTLTTVFVRQGHYATEVTSAALSPPPDLQIGAIAELIDHDFLEQI